MLQPIHAQPEEVVVEPNENDRDGGFRDTVEFPNFARFLRETVFGQKDASEDVDNKSNRDPFSGLLEGAPQGSDIFRQFSNLFRDATEKDQEGESFQTNNDFLSDLISSVASSQQQESEPLEQLIEIFWTAAKRVHKQLENTFKDALEQFSLNPLQAFYHMQQQEIEKNSVYKRKKHAFMPPLTLEQAIPLAEGLFLSQLAYVDTCDHVLEHLKSFHNNTWALLNCSCTGKPSQPAHFVAVRKEAEALQSKKNLLKRILNQEDDESDVLEVVIVVRGSKEIADFISDGLLEPVDYRGGKAHDGILSSAQWLHQQYVGFFASLLELTGRQKLKLWCVGHSLGAGTAALASLEFNAATNNNGTINARALGFGTPATISKDLSLALKSTVTTVVNDADCIPRMSGANLVNAWIKASSYQDWVDEAQHDIRMLMNVMKQNLPFPDLTEAIFRGLLAWLDSLKENRQPPSPKHDGTKFRAKQILYPPGECIHLYRDGTKWQGVYMPCTDFDEIEAVGHLVSDHLIPSGYYIGLLNYLRVLKRDWNWQFNPDLMELPVPTG